MKDENSFQVYSATKNKQEKKITTLEMARKSLCPNDVINLKMHFEV